MKNGWATVPLGEAISHRKEFVQIDDTQPYKRCRVQLHANGIVLRDEILGAEIKTKKQQVCQDGELLVAEIDAKLGGYGIVPKALGGAIVSSHYFLYEIDDTKLDRGFLGYYLKTPAFRDQVAAQGSTNYAAIRPGHVLEYDVPLPLLAEQRRIVAKLDQLAAKIEEANRLRSETTSMVQAMSRQMLTDAFSHVIKELTTIGGAFKVTTGGTPSRSNLAYWGGPINWVSSGEVAFCRIAGTREKITEIGERESNAKRYPRNTVLLAMIGQGKTRGQCAILDCEAATNQNVAAIHVAETPHVPEYVYQWLRARYLESRSTETGTAQPALSGKRVREMPIPLPDAATQKTIVEKIRSTEALLSELMKAHLSIDAKWHALLPSILDKAFNGEL